MKNLTLVEKQVDIWRIDLFAPEEQILDCRGLLSQDESQRADRFHFQKHRRRFTVARAAMRQILGSYACRDPQELVFLYGTNGKPELSGELERSGIKFNLSHSNETALLAIAHGVTLGIDLEFVNPESATDEIATRFFSAREVECLRALTAETRVDGFFSCWTRKEAYIKALGEGLSVPLDSFEVAFGPGVTAALLAVRDNPAEIKRWSMYNLKAPERYKAALVAEGRGHRLRELRWDSATLA